MDTIHDSSDIKSIIHFGDDNPPYSVELLQGEIVVHNIKLDHPINLIGLLPYGATDDDGEYQFTLRKRGECIVKTKNYSAEAALKNLAILHEYFKSLNINTPPVSLKSEEDEIPEEKIERKAKGEKKRYKWLVFGFITFIIFGIVNLLTNTVKGLQTNTKAPAANQFFNIFLIIFMIVALYIYIKKRVKNQNL